MCQTPKFQTHTNRQALHTYRGRCLAATLFHNCACNMPHYGNFGDTVTYCVSACVGDFGLCVGKKVSICGLVEHNACVNNNLLADTVGDLCLALVTSVEELFTLLGNLDKSV